MTKKKRTPRASTIRFTTDRTVRLAGKVARVQIEVEVNAWAQKALTFVRDVAEKKGTSAEHQARASRLMGWRN